MKKINTFVLGLSIIFCFNISLSFYPKSSILGDKIQIADSTETIDFSSWEFQDLEFGYDFSLLWATDANNQDHVFTWGNNDFGQLGNGTTDSVFYPTEVTYCYDQNSDPVNQLPSGWKIQNISSSDNNVIASVTDSAGTYYLYTLGDNTNGQLGIDSNADYVTTPTLVTLPSDLGPNYVIDNLAISETNSIISVSDSNDLEHIYTWGSNTSGQLGVSGSGQQLDVPTEIAYPTDPVFSGGYTIEGVYANQAAYSSNLTSGTSFIWVRDEENKDHLYGAGANIEGELLGDSADAGDSISEFSEIAYPPSFNSSTWSIVDFYSSSAHWDIENNDNQVAIYNGLVLEDENGTQHLYTWGSNENANLSNGTLDNSSKIKEINYYDSNNTPTNPNDDLTYLPAGWTIESIDSYYDNSVAVVKDSINNYRVYYWGDDNSNGTSTYYQSSPSNNQYYLTPIEISYPSNQYNMNNNQPTAVEFSGSFGGMITNDADGSQSIYMWGNNVNNNMIEYPYVPNTKIFSPIKIFETDEVVNNEPNFYFYLFIIYGVLIIAIIIFILVLYLKKNKIKKQKMQIEEKIVREDFN